MALYPLLFKPRLLEKMWAGRKIQTVLGKPLPPGKNIGESAKRGMTSINQLRIINGQLLITRSIE